MSTRSILALQKGNHVRYCFLHWDGDNHGRTLKEMLDTEIDDLYNKMSPLDEGTYVYLSHLYPQSYWESYIEAQKKSWKKRFKNMKGFKECYMSPQDTAYDPMPDHSAEMNPVECGAYDTKRKFPKTVKAALNGTYPFWCCEYVWFYNLDTKTITFFSSNNKWKMKQMARRTRKTPKKFSFPWLEDQI